MFDNAVRCEGQMKAYGDGLQLNTVEQTVNLFSVN